MPFSVGARSFFFHKDSSEGNFQITLVIEMKCEDTAAHPDIAIKPINHVGNSIFYNSVCEMS